jgi:hypothetical protein
MALGLPVVQAGLPYPLSAAATKPAAAGAAAKPARIAVVIGNGGYLHADRLPNPANDAQAMADLLQQADFQVSSHIDASRETMVAALENFTQAMRGPQVELGLLYYAGHGVQLDWRNYLLPIDAAVESDTDLRQRCVDLNQIMSRLAQARGKTLVVMLDACRDNPFGKNYHLPQAGLSQFDAPPGSLLAYATAPGKVAADGSSSAQHGLYTTYLLNELAKPATRMEDALKRVRVFVRLASNGEQVPWETTSLEQDVFLFGAKPVQSEAEMEREAEREYAEWSRIKTSERQEDWVRYLLEFPNGRFSEIANARLARLTAVPPPPKFDGSRGLLGGLSIRKHPRPPRPMPVNVDQDHAAPANLMPRLTPYSAGSYALSRVFTVGDAYTIRETDQLSGTVLATVNHKVSKVDASADRVEVDDGTIVLDMMGNPIKLPDVEYDAPVQFTPADFQLGKKWTAIFRQIQNGKSTRSRYDCKIVARENVTVPAGTFDCFKLEGRSALAGQSAQLELNWWLVPGLNAAVRSERILRKDGRVQESKLQELVALNQQNHQLG